MNASRYVIGSIVVWVFIFLFEYLLHAVVLEGYYQDIAHLLRTTMGGEFFLWVLISEFLLSFGFCYIFIKGRENRGLAEGFRFGLLIGITFGVSSTLAHYAVYPMTGKLAAGLVIGYPVEMILAGLIIAAIYRPKAARA
ncbi:MAG TPA: hypothetical protein VMY05_01355 [Acidobacteriota bacterium]|nr:hypothetical protein [Acidobacteriota bacterium]